MKLWGNKKKKANTGNGWDTGPISSTQPYSP